MDISKTYIEMCKKAEELQRGWLAQSGDFVCLHGKVEWIDPFCSCWSAEYSREIVEDDVWLPRQDQLQELIGGYYVCLDKITYYANEVARSLNPLRGKDGDKLVFPKSMEQLWLALVMNMKYNRIWNGQEWVEND